MKAISTQIARIIAEDNGWEFSDDLYNAVIVFMTEHSIVMVHHEPEITSVTEVSKDDGLIINRVKF